MFNPDLENEIQWKELDPTSHPGMYVSNRIDQYIQLVKETKSQSVKSEISREFGKILTQDELLFLRSNN